VSWHHINNYAVTKGLINRRDMRDLKWSNQGRYLAASLATSATPIIWDSEKEREISTLPCNWYWNRKSNPFLSFTQDDTHVIQFRNDGLLIQSLTDDNPSHHIGLVDIFDKEEDREASGIDVLEHSSKAANYFMDTNHEGNKFAICASNPYASIYIYTLDLRSDNVIQNCVNIRPQSINKLVSIKFSLDGRYLFLFHAESDHVWVDTIDCDDYKIISREAINIFGAVKMAIEKDNTQPYFYMVTKDLLGYTHYHSYNVQTKQLSYPVTLHNISFTGIHHVGDRGFVIIKQKDSQNKTSLRCLKNPYTQSVHNTNAFTEYKFNSRYVGIHPYYDMIALYMEEGAKVEIREFVNDMDLHDQRRFGGMKL
jgi:hypothetical protein